jgi:DNA-binding protein HU-beta
VTKSELINAMAENADTSKAAAKRFLDAFTDTVSDALTKGDKITLVGFGTFSVSDRKERQGINPKTREKMTIAASKAPKFKAGKALKDKVS